jgi:hypothetical protein
MKASLIGDRDSTVSGKFVSCGMGVQGQAADAQNGLNGVEAKIQQVKQLQQAGAATAPMIPSLVGKRVLLYLFVAAVSAPGVLSAATAGRCCSHRTVSLAGNCLPAISAMPVLNFPLFCGNSVSCGWEPAAAAGRPHSCVSHFQVTFSCTCGSIVSHGCGWQQFWLVHVWLNHVSPVYPMNLAPDTGQYSQVQHCSTHYNTIQSRTVQQCPPNQPVWLHYLRDDITYVICLLPT